MTLSQYLYLLKFLDKTKPTPVLSEESSFFLLQILKAIDFFVCKNGINNKVTALLTKLHLSYEENSRYFKYLLFKIENKSFPLENNDTIEKFKNIIIKKGVGLERYCPLNTGDAAPVASPVNFFI